MEPTRNTKKLTPFFLIYSNKHFYNFFYFLRRNLFKWLFVNKLNRGGGIIDWKNRSAYVFIKTKEGKANEVWQRFHNWDNIIGTWIVTGDWDVIAWFDATDWDTVHRCVTDIKNWDEVEHTSSHMVYNGYKNGYWWWEKPAGTWVLMKEKRLGNAHDYTKRWNWITSGASIPGDWDYMAWIEGENWNDVWNHLYELKSENFEVYAQVPIKSWWNQSWKDKWWY